MKVDIGREASINPSVMVMVMRSQACSPAVSDDVIRSICFAEGEKMLSLVASGTTFSMFFAWLSCVAWLGGQLRLGETSARPP
jgi:hypothetical protein